MDNEIREKLMGAGIDVDEGVTRFLDDYDMFCELILKFFETNQLIELKENLDKKNISGAFDAAHSLKGVCGNLSITCLSDIIKPMVESLRKENITDEEKAIDTAIEYYEKLEKEYEVVEKVVNEVLI